MKSLLLSVLLACLLGNLLVEGAAIVLEKQGAVRLDGECNSYDREKLNEGYRTCVYKDSRGIPTIGVGFNLDKFGAKGEIESVGADYDKVLAGTECLNDNQIKELFDKDMDTAVSCAEGFVSGIGDTAESAIADMAFNMGCATLHTFSTFKSLLEQKQFEKAAEDMQGTLWCSQVGSRCSRDVACIKDGH